MGDGVAELVRVCWVSHDQFILSELRIRPRCRQLESQMLIDLNREQAKDKSGQAEVRNQGIVNEVQNSSQAWGQGRQRFAIGSQSCRY